MTLFKMVGLAIFSLILAGCAAPKVFVLKPYFPVTNDSFEYQIVEQVPVAPEALTIFTTQLEKSLSAANLKQGDSTKRVEITFTSYSMRNGAARAIAGVLAGSDYVVTQVVVKAKDTGDILATVRVISENNKAVGSTRGLLEQHATKIVTYLKTGKA